MSEKRYAEAAALYTQAITLHENSAIFWANRSALSLTRAYCYALSVQACCQEWAICAICSGIE